MTPEKLIRAARKIVGQFELSHADFSAGKVGAALLSAKGNIYTGINIELACGIGFCAEHSAIAEMLKNRETQIDMIVATNNKSIIPPCGRCRELMFQVNRSNMNTKIYLTGDRYMTLAELLPNPWEPSL
ncbi:MAG TPA: cytidine deaminase [Sulfurovum sp. UBA12169]|nr:MAG TPA: cytidine deaminase [Sulfurovum sp. UBA12169]